MPKFNFKDILTNRDATELEKVSYPEEKVEKDLEELEKERKEILKRKEVNWQKLNSTVIRHSK